MRPIQHVEVVRVIPHPVERVFRRYTDHVGWSDWAGVGPVRLVRSGSEETNGVGSVRAFSLTPGLREEVIVFVPPERTAYRITQGPLPLTDHRGEVTFEPVHDEAASRSTRVTWRASFRSSIPGLGWLLEHGLDLLFGRMLAGLARDLDRGGDR